MVPLKKTTKTRGKCSSVACNLQCVKGWAVRRRCWRSLLRTDMKETIIGSNIFWGPVNFFKRAATRMKTISLTNGANGSAQPTSPVKMQHHWKLVGIHDGMCWFHWI